MKSIMPCTTAFLSTPSARRATDYKKHCQKSEKFLSTPSARRATQNQRTANQSVCISIHALREEGDLGDAYYQAHQARSQ